MLNSLKVKKPKKIESTGNTTIVETLNGNVINIDLRGASLTGAKIYVSNPLVQKSISNEFQTLDGDSNVTGMELLDAQNTSLVRIDRSEFPSIAEIDFSDIELIDGENNRVVYLTASLHIKALDYGLKKAWSFFYNGHIINAKIKDEKFAAEVVAGNEAFRNGDTLNVVLAITQHLDEASKIWFNKSYSIKEVKEHHRRSDPPENMQLFS